MAMANVNAEECRLNDDVDLEVVKQLIAQQESKYDVSNYGLALFRWPIRNFLNHNTHWNSYLFPMLSDEFVGQLELNYFEDRCHLKLNIKRVKNGGRSETTAAASPSFRHFIGKLQFYDREEKLMSKQSVFSTNSLKPDSDREVISFEFSEYDQDLEEVVVVEVCLYEDSDTLKNAVLGKIEGFKEKQSAASPRFNFGSADHTMVVRFWQGYGYNWDDQGLSITMEIIQSFSHKSLIALGTPFSLKLSFTIFNQKETGTNLVKKVIVPTELNKWKYSIFVALNKDLEDLGVLESDTLYYKAKVEPFNLEFQDVKDKEPFDLKFHGEINEDMSYYLESRDETDPETMCFTLQFRDPSKNP